MGTQDILTERDLRALLDVVDRASEPLPGEEFPSAVLWALEELIPSEECLFQLQDPVREVTWWPYRWKDGAFIGVDEGAEDPELTQLFWEGVRCSQACPFPMDAVLRESDKKGTDFHSELGLDYSEQVGLTYDLGCYLPQIGTTERQLWMYRSEGPDFTDHDVLLMRLIRPHIDEIHRRQRLRVLGRPELTPRQWEIVRLVAAGASNSRIGRVLKISEATVRKHLENIFFRLDVASRTEAVAKVAPFLQVA